MKCLFLIYTPSQEHLSMQDTFTLTFYLKESRVEHHHKGLQLGKRRYCLHILDLGESESLGQTLQLITQKQKLKK